MLPADHWMRLRRQLLVALLVLTMTLAGLLVLALVGSSTGLVGFLIGICLAAIPVPVVLAALRWLDRYEPEPRGVLLFCFFWGATVAALAATIINSASALALARAGAGGQAGLADTALLVAPWVEEAAKGLAVLLVLVFRRREVDGVVDGIVLAGLSGLGFAFTENILYFGRAFLSGEDLGLTGGIFAVGITFVLRGVLSPFAHPLFTSMLGLGVGLAVTTRRPAVRVLAPVAGYLAGALLHFVWNASSLAGTGAFFSGYVTVMVPVFAVTAAVAHWARRREGLIVARHLPAYVQAGWLTPHDVTMVASLPRRRQAQEWAEGALGPRGRAALQAFQHAATELAFLRARADRVLAPDDFVRRERDLLDQLSQARDRANRG